MQLMDRLPHTPFDQPAERLRTENIHLQKELEQAQQQVAEAQTRLNLIAKAISSVVIDWDLTTNQFFRFNSPETLMGYGPDEMAYSLDEFRNGVHPEDLPRFDYSLREWLQGNETSFDLEVRSRHKDGSYRDLRGHAVVIREVDTARPLRVVASYSDVTPERQALRSLQLSEERYRLATEATQGIVFDWNLTSNAVYRSSGVERLLGYDSKEVMPSPEWWLDKIHPEDRGSVLSLVQTFFEPGQSHGNITYRVRHSLGHYLHVHSNYLVIRDSTGRAERVAGCIVDLTPRIMAEEAQHLAEKNFHQLFHDNPLGLVVISPTRQILECNQAFARMLNLSITQIMDKRVSEIPGIAECLENISTTEFDQLKVWEKQLLRSDGTRVPVQIRCKLISYQKHDEPCLFGMIEDLTSRQRAELEKRQLELHLQETQKLESLGVLAGGIAHDFNNLLTVILGNLSLIRQDTPRNSQTYEALQQSEQASVQAAELCRQMLAYAGRGKLENRPFDLSVLVESSKALLGSAAGKHTALHFHLSTGIPSMAGDPSQIRQVLLNLVQNAAEAIPPAGGTIDVLTGVGSLDDTLLKKCLFYQQHQSGDYLWLEVRDSGQGMDDATCKRIFEPFFTTKFTGRGLGLAAVAGIVRNHRGLIQYHSEPQIGTFFRIYFPIDRSVTAPTVPATPGSQEVGKPSSNQGTILVVDDEPTVRTVLARLLAKRGFVVIEAENGNEALEMVARHANALRLIILDLTMPHRDGLSTLEELRKLQNQVPVVIISGYYSSELIPRLEQLNAKFVSKPFSAQGLLATIDPLLSVK